MLKHVKTDKKHTKKQDNKYKYTWNKNKIKKTNNK